MGHHLWIAVIGRYVLKEKGLKARLVSSGTQVRIPSEIHLYFSLKFKWSSEVSIFIFVPWLVSAKDWIVFLPYLKILFCQHVSINRVITQIIPDLFPDNYSNTAHIQSLNCHNNVNNIIASFHSIDCLWWLFFSLIRKDTILRTSEYLIETQLLTIQTLMQ